VFLALASSAGAADEPAIVSITAKPDRLLFEFAAAAGQRVRLVELRPYETYTAENATPAEWEGPACAHSLELRRFKDGRDRLFSKWQLAHAESGRPYGRPQYATDFTELPERNKPFSWPKSIKGLQSVVDVDDAIKLGVKHVAHNVLISQVLDLSGSTDAEHWTVDGEKIAIDGGYIGHLDKTIEALTAAGVNVTIILLNAVPTKPDAGNPLIHPSTDLAAAPNHLGAFNLTDERGLRHYRAAVEFLADRYSDPTGKHGSVSGYIIGNELQAHWWWYNIGTSTPQAVISDYARAVRIAHLAARKIHSGIRTYVSLDHHWTARMTDDRRKFIPGKELLDGLHSLITSEGNFDWHVAQHPYPENLFDPRTWDDRDATLDFDTKKITFKNIEILAQYLAQPQWHASGSPRRIILSEQGFHSPEGEQGERLQAAAYAYAYYRARHVDGIDAFILHRHVDHQHEGGLRLGVRARKENTVTTPGRKKFLYDVFQRADSQDWQDVFEFAKPIIGIDDWSELLPRTVTSKK